MNWLYPLTCFLLLSPSCVNSAEKVREADVIVYGDTSGGISAAIQVKRKGKSVILIAPSERIGGLTTNGLGQTDIGNKAAIGGISREFYQRVAQHYAKDSAWTWEKKTEYRSGGQSRTAQGEDTMWTFEPKVALQIFQQMLKEASVTVIKGRLNRKSGVKKSRNSIKSIELESGEKFIGKMFIDATYEGDLLAAAGVDYIVGREANSQYQETLNGVQTAHAIKHQLMRGIDPYLKKGDPKSGLLPGIDPKGPGKEGSRDHRVQAYCFRMCMTDHPKNRIPFAKPEDYDPQLYELMLRNFEAGAKVLPLNIGHMPNRKTDTNNNRGFSTDFIGQNYEYPEADYATRDKIVQRHLSYQKGLMWTMANHPRVPESIRKAVSRWGMSKDEFETNEGWPLVIYVREARRMIGQTVMTQHHCQGRVLAKDVVGMAAYTMDSHNVQRYVDAKGQVRNEGDVQVGGFPPYPISYGSLIPQEKQCNNLLVPVCLSASHIAFGSIRMEPVFMVLGQSAATAATFAIDDDVSVQKVDYDKLREQLLKDKQVLEWKGKRRPPSILLSKLEGIVIDDSATKELGLTRSGFVTTSGSVGPFVGSGYRHDSNEQKADQWARYTPKIEKAGTYEVRLYYTPHQNRASNVPVIVQCSEGRKTFTVNQRKKLPKGKAYHLLGKFPFASGKSSSVEIRAEGTNGYVIIDAVQWVPVK